MPVLCPVPEVAAAANPFDTKSLPSARFGRLGHLARFAVAALVAAAAVAGCGRQAEPAPEVRPVRLMQLSQHSGRTAFEFSGDVRPRVESRLGFRVGGKIAARLVDVGAIVTRGQPLARLDPTDLSLAEAGSRAQFEAAKTDRDLAASDLKRYNDLFAKGFISAAEQHRRQASFEAADSRLRQAQAGLRSQSNQTAYAVLHADADGVVTAIDAEVGQVVTPGQPVVRVAQTAEKEVAIGLPEDQVDLLRGIADVSIHTWAEPQRALPGRVREIAAAADPVTRTYATRVTIPDPPADLKLGMTAVVTFVRTGATPAIRVPLTALLQEQGRNQVWVYDAAAGTVKPVTVTLGEAVGNEVEVRQGLAPGQTIVTAGVHLLRPGQKVRPLQAVAPASAPTAAPTAAAPKQG
ncbi:efflux RND transporter periplasmic adaptor subunit [Cupriavidus oxalaticus]|uniref:Efflux RND transporter periplasmic adaptor subunit n=1 Tax=Cupriavidus oxalaticus TaxID=96344 RepID=A0A375FX34_9BURK|nr:efflux RND transporter periplasmic adaptor subunit [Cupriavidus oxalaticus]QRQ86141.1 efflux RND transporter periplasmic adaptor subunit [Cupriavidus oxalaticus]QRQ95532.1 efflux RND transporter periplasmic adaptor subunit [Cupriavidus oxalaticus]WQD84197.1 efflux RND transporter periplasmic adaptor subunit [Cupriavidus oxalaticus]SPC12071.1 RND transporter MFP subunit [Cupriavidus oxalaticus]